MVLTRMMMIIIIIISSSISSSSSSSSSSIFLDTSKCNLRPILVEQTTARECPTLSLSHPTAIVSHSGLVHPQPVGRKFLHFSSSRLIWWMSLRTCGINKKLIILHPFSVSHKQAVFYGLINAHNVLGRLSEPNVKRFTLCIFYNSLVFYFKAPKLCRTFKL